MRHNLPLCFHLWLCLLGELKLYEASLQRPSISFSASYATYLTGEPVILQCQTTVDFTIHGYKFFKNDREIPRLEISSNRLRISSAKKSDDGSYSCQYWVLDSRGKQQSDVSFPISLTILDQPSQPRLLVTPRQSLYFEGESVTLECEHHPVHSQVRYEFHKDNSKLDSYHDSLRSNRHIEGLSSPLSSAPRLNFVPSYATFIKGENVSMQCVAPSPVILTLYRFYKEGVEIRGPLSSKGLLSLHNITKKDQALYTCMYWSPTSNREIPSTQSDEREIYVIDHLRPPMLSADPPSGRIKDGGNVTLYCLIRESYKRAIFHFLNETDEVTSVHTYNPQTRAAAITIIVKKNNNTSPAKYSCQYTAEIKGRLLLSPKSPQVEITVITTGSLLWLIAIGVAAGIAVLIIIVSLVYWVLSGKKGIALIFAYVICLLGNVLSITVISLDQNLQAPMYFFLRSLATSDMLFVSSTAPKLVATLVSGDNALTCNGCLLQLYFYVVVGTIEFYTLGLLSVDRYLAICHPLRYNNIMTDQFCWKVIVCLWIAGILEYMPAFVLMFQLQWCSNSGFIDHFFCDGSALLNLSCSDTQVVQNMFFSFTSFAILGTLIPTILSYCFILYSIFSIASSSGRSKTFSTCSSHFIAVVFAYGSCIFIYISPAGSISSSSGKVVAVFNSIFCPLLHPFIYSLRNQMVMTALKNVCRQNLPPAMVDHIR
ncbi:PREDICTED: uncharacterized protein LOC108792363 [Nanorana parkeri]|uniref:uncharacterized protein LOC108792363 n=1 Tax=Nanorana parkeri TaxID=125878 RepID=UPI0008543A80|nr:PREDICTED: uncharacterized protein LOC108792363 [Nanorana parkeri]